MQKKLAIKLGIIVGLCLMLLVPLMMIEGQIVGRNALQADVIRDISESAAGSQTLVGPVLIVRFKERTTRVIKNWEDNTERTTFNDVERSLTLPLQNLDITGDATVETRKRGIYSANLYQMDMRINGKIEIPANLGQEKSIQLAEPAKTYLVMGISDLRGVGNDPEVMVNGKPFRFTTTSEEAVAGRTLVVSLGAFDPQKGGKYEVEFPLKLMGTEFFAVSPTASETGLRLKSTWRHPSFQGRFLPQTREISKNGFNAFWQVSHLARNFEQALQGYDALSISFVEPVNIYLKAERAVKYGLIFIVLTFSAFFLLEIVRRSPIHPLQYLMVGLAQAIFFLLLIALSEHVPFVWAYLASSLGCIGLIGIYLAGIFKNIRQGALFGAGLALLYGILYGVLSSEDSALLMGSLLLFTSLGAVMLLTRRINWYQIGDYGQKTEAHQPHSVP